MATRLRVYDKLKWHEDGDTSAGFFLGWAAKRDLLSDDIAPKDARGAKAGKMSGLSLLEVYGGSLASDLLSDEGNAFAAVLYASKAGPLPKTVRALDAAFAAWRARKTPPKKGKAMAKLSSEVEGRLVRLRAKAKKKHAVEVEHLLPFAQLGDKSAAAALRALADEHHWPRGGRGLVRLGTWVDVIALYLESGLASLVRQAKARKVDADFVVSLLEELEPSPEVARAGVELAEWARKGKNASLVGSALDVVGTHLDDGDFAPDAKLAKAARSLAHEQLEGKLQPIDVFRCYKVLGAVGDASSLELMLSRPPLTNEWKGSEKEPLAALRKRLGAKR